MHSIEKSWSKHCISHPAQEHEKAIRTSVLHHGNAVLPPAPSSASLISLLFHSGVFFFPSLSSLVALKPRWKLLSCFQGCRCKPSPWAAATISVHVLPEAAVGLQRSWIAEISAAESYTFHLEKLPSEAFFFFSWFCFCASASFGGKSCETIVTKARSVSVPLFMMHLINPCCLLSNLIFLTWRMNFVALSP